MKNIQRGIVLPGRLEAEALLSKIILAAGMMMAVVFPFSFALFNIGIVAVIVGTILRRVVRKDPSLFDPFLDTAALLFFVVSCFSVAGSDYLGMSLQGVHKLLRYLLLFLAAREIISERKNLKPMFAALLVGVLIASLDGFLQIALGVDPLRGQTPMVGFRDLIRISGSFPNPNALAIYLSALLPLVFCTAYYGKPEKKIARGLFALFAMLMFCLYLTYARPAFIALIVNAGLLLILKRDKRLILIFLVPGLIGALLLSGEVKHWLMGLNTVQDFFVDQGRYFHQHAALNMIKARPWFGMGLNTFDINYEHYRLAGDTFTRWSAHQGYLQMAAETGLLGLGAFLTLLGGIILYCRKGYSLAKLPFTKACVMGLIGGLISFLIVGFFESIFWQPRQANFFWFWSGLMCGVAKLLISENTHEAK